MTDIFSYFLKNFALFYHFDSSVPGYGVNSDAKVRIIQNCPADFFSGKKDISIENVKWIEWKGNSIPVLFEGKNNIGEIITRKDSFILINCDIIASCFYFLSGWNEYVSQSRDTYGRIAYADSIISDLNILKIPVVNYYFDILFEALQNVSQTERKTSWSADSFPVFLTHDIDRISTGWKDGVKKAIKKFNPWKLIEILFMKMLGEDLFFTFKKIMRIEERLNVPSTYFFLRRIMDSGPISNADYSHSSRRIKRVLRSLIKSNKEIGVHGSYGAQREVQHLKDDINAFDSCEISGNRFHYLMFDPDQSVSVLEKAGIRYDSSLGFAEEAGFRRATCFPFYLFDFQQMKSSNVLEIPLIAMDTTLIEEQYLNLDSGSVLLYLAPVIEEVKKFGGVFTLLWHNNYFNNFLYPGWDELYSDIIEYCRKSNSSFHTGKELLKKCSDE